RPQPRAAQERVDGHVLMRTPRPRPPSDTRLVEDPSAVVKALEGPAHREITRGTDVASAQMAREKPLGRPATEAADGGERLDHLLVRALGERLQIEAARGDMVREAHDILRLPGGQLKPAQLVHLSPGELRRLGKAVHRLAGHVDGNAEAVHETRFDGK